MNKSTSFAHSSIGKAQIAINKTDFKEQSDKTLKKEQKINFKILQVGTDQLEELLTKVKPERKKDKEYKILQGIIQYNRELIAEELAKKSDDISFAGVKKNNKNNVSFHGNSEQNKEANLLIHSHSALAAGIAVAFHQPPGADIAPLMANELSMAMNMGVNYLPYENPITQRAVGLCMGVDTVYSIANQTKNIIGWLASVSGSSFDIVNGSLYGSSLITAPIATALTETFGHMVKSKFENDEHKIYLSALKGVTNSSVWKGELNLTPEALGKIGSEFSDEKLEELKKDILTLKVPVLYDSGDKMEASARIAQKVQRIFKALEATPEIKAENAKNSENFWDDFWKSLGSGVINSYTSRG